MQGSSVVRLHFVSIDIEFYKICKMDALYVYDGANTSAPLLGKHCGSSSPPDYQSTSVSLLLHLHSDTFTAGNGFKGVGGKLAYSKLGVGVTCLKSVIDLIFYTLLSQANIRVLK